MAARGVNGVALASIGAGAIFLYAGVKGYSIPAALQNVIRGQAPGAGQASSALVTATSPSSSALSPNQTSSAGVVASSASRSQWATALLAVGNWPQTKANTESVEAWENREGGGGRNNPLNTTLVYGGSTPLAGNSAGVQNYPSIQTGLEATVATLNGGAYSDLVMALSSGQGLCGRSWAGLSTWSGGGYSSVC